MVIGQVILILPVVTVFTISAISRIDDRYRKTAMTLGREGYRRHSSSSGRRASHCRSGHRRFGRVIAEVGVAMMLGGNAKGSPGP